MNLQKIIYRYIRKINFNNLSELEKIGLIALTKDFVITTCYIGFKNRKEELVFNKKKAEKWFEKLEKNFNL